MMKENTHAGLLDWLTAFRNGLKTGVRPQEMAADAGVTDVETSPAPLPANPGYANADAVTQPPTESTDCDVASDRLDNKPWLDLTEDCLALFEEIDRNRDFFEMPGEQQLAEHISLRLQEILERTGLEIIDTDGPFDRNLHQPDRSVAGVAPELLAVEVRSPGFRIGRRILRRARVHLLDFANEPSSPAAVGGETS